MTITPILIFTSPHDRVSNKFVDDQWSIGRAPPILPGPYPSVFIWYVVEELARDGDGGTNDYGL